MLHQHRNIRCATTTRSTLPGPVRKQDSLQEANCKTVHCFKKTCCTKGKRTNKADLRMVDWQLLPFKMHLSRHTNPQISMQAHTHTEAGPKLLLLQSFACFHLKTPWRQRVCARLLPLSPLPNLTWTTCASVLYLASSSLSAASWCPRCTA